MKLDLFLFCSTSWETKMKRDDFAIFSAHYFHCVFMVFFYYISINATKEEFFFSLFKCFSSKVIKISIELLYNKLRPLTRISCNSAVGNAFGLAIGRTQIDSPLRRFFFCSFIYLLCPFTLIIT